MGNPITIGREDEEITHKRVMNYVAQVYDILNRDVDFLDNLVENLPKETEAQQVAHRLLNTLRKVSKVGL